MFVVHATKNPVPTCRAPRRSPGNLQPATNLLGAWYVTERFWQPQVALFVNEPTRSPVFVALAPSASVIARMTQTAAAVFSALGVSERFIDEEVVR
jgi:hypothetical protein